MEKKTLQRSAKKLQEKITQFEQKVWNSGAYLCGVDEVGRGAFAGPVVTSAVILKPFCVHKLLVDSKILSENNRLEAAAWITCNSWYAFGLADVHEIDRVGIYRATQLAMLRALYTLFMQPHAPFPVKVIIDAMPLSLSPALDPAPIVEHYNYGETLSISVAAASILAKVKRDALLNRWKTTYPAYTFATHKAYGTAEHHEQIIAHGATPIHRATFIKNLLQGLLDESRQGCSRSDQISLFC